MQVQVDKAGVLHTVVLKGRGRRVEAVQEVWRVDEGWWRARPVARHYVRLVLDDGRQVTVYRDLLEGGWWLQHY